MTRLADRQPSVPIGVAFVDASGVPGWIGDDAALRVHAPSLWLLATRPRAGRQ